MSLSFVFLTPPATSCQLPATPASSRSSRSQSGSSERTGVPVFCLVACVPRLTVSVCSLAGAGPRVRLAPQCRWALLPGARAWWLPPPSFCLLISVRGFTAPRFVPQYSALEMFICRDPDVSSYVSGRFVSFQDGLGPIQLYSGDQLKKGTPSSTILTSPSSIFIMIC